MGLLAALLAPVHLCGAGTCSLFWNTLRTSEGFYRTHAGIEQAISRGLAYAPYADLVWCETSTPDLALAKRRLSR
jgi:isocitrate lyase